MLHILLLIMPYQDYIVQTRTILLPYLEDKWPYCDVAACRAVSYPASFFREISCFFPLNLGTLFRCCVLGQGTSPSNASLDSAWSWNSTRMNRSSWPGYTNVNSDNRSSDLISAYKLAPLPLSWHYNSSYYTDFIMSYSDIQMSYCDVKLS